MTVPAVDAGGAGAPAVTPEPPKPTPPAKAPETPAGDQPKGDDEALREPGKKALESERAARAAAEKKLADLQKEIEDSKKSAEEKATEALTAAQKAAEESAAKALRYEVAAEKGLPLALAARLSGTTKDELTADADALKALIPDAKPGTPKPDPSAGAAGDPKPKNMTEAINAHYKVGG